MLLMPRGRYQCYYWSGSAILGLNAGHTAKNLKDYLIGTLCIGWSALSQVFRVRMVANQRRRRYRFIMKAPTSTSESEANAAASGVDPRQRRAVSKWGRERVAQCRIGGMRLTPLPSLVVPDIWGRWQGFVEIEPLVSGFQKRRLRNR
ncbi:hypothetical protein RIB2604_01704900 [Aspergillus luchuensis]|uniref:Uncharacterized protein n=1 Tax=Aspergillus kawachii TaxID=1069201 RepID=A0A146FCG1_ASPKA|nr:hypothetical protein RIB2604_01704900 [Aspergillus luchuensis]